MIQEENIERINNTVSFSNDLFFKYAFSRDCDVSLQLRKKLIYLISGIKCKELTVRNPEINQSHVNAKNIILDIMIKDEYDHPIDLEIQMRSYETSEKKRFQFYGARMLVNQLEQGKKYYELNKVYQYILINEKNPHRHDLIECYMFRNAQNEIETANLNERYYVYMKEIRRILKNKKKGELNDLERLCSLFIKNNYDDIIKDEKNDIIRQVVEMYKEFKKDKKLWDLGNERELALIREESLKMEYEDRVAKGIKEGIEQGKKYEKRNSCIKMLKKRYQKDCSKWVAQLNDKQLEQIYEYIFEETDFEKLKQRINEPYK